MRDFRKKTYVVYKVKRDVKQRFNCPTRLPYNLYNWYLEAIKHWQCIWQGDIYAQYQSLVPIYLVFISKMR